MTDTPSLFGIIPTGYPPILAPTANPTPTSFLYTIPRDPSRPFSHIVVFLIPNTPLPPSTAAAVYIQTPSAPNGFRFLGGIGTGKESAIFRIRGLDGANGGNNGGEVDMDAEDTGGEVNLGISIESAESVSAQMAALQAAPKAESQALVVAARKPDTLLLAQRIIKNAFNFLASFSGNVNGGVEVVPLKALRNGGGSLRGGLGAIRAFWRGLWMTEEGCLVMRHEKMASICGRCAWEEGAASQREVMDDLH